MKNRIMGELKKVFRPEFLNRIDDVIVFHKLQKDEIKQIVELLLLRIRESMAERELQLELTDPAKDMLVEKGWDPSMGARPLRRAIQRYIEDPLADFVLREQLIPGATVVVDPGPEGEEDEVRLTIVKPKKQKTPVAVGAGEGAGARGARAAGAVRRGRGRECGRPTAIPSPRRACGSPPTLRVAAEDLADDRRRLAGGRAHLCGRHRRPAMRRSSTPCPRWEEWSRRASWPQPRARSRATGARRGVRLGGAQPRSRARGLSRRGRGQHLRRPRVRAPRDRSRAARALIEASEQAGLVDPGGRHLPRERRLGRAARALRLPARRACAGGRADVRRALARRGAV